MQRHLNIIFLIHTYLAFTSYTSWLHTFKLYYTVADFSLSHSHVDILLSSSFLYRVSPDDTMQPLPLYIFFPRNKRIFLILHTSDFATCRSFRKLIGTFIPLSPFTHTVNGTIWNSFIKHSDHQYFLLYS